MVKITISLEPEFADKFMGLLKNLIAVNSDKKTPMLIESVIIDDEIVAYPKGEIDVGKNKTGG